MAAGDGVEGWRVRVEGGLGGSGSRVQGYGV